MKLLDRDSRVTWTSFLLRGLLWATPVFSAQRVDHSLYGELLQKYMKNGVVDYQGFKREEAVLDAYLAVLEQTDTKTLPREEQFAFYINAYNAWTIKLILGAYPGVTSIKELGSLFKWYSEDCQEGIVPFFSKYARGQLKESLQEQAEAIRVRYLDYDWSLNGKSPLE